jgi:hypothetical protein
MQTGPDLRRCLGRSYLRRSDVSQKLCDWTGSHVRAFNFELS